MADSSYRVGVYRERGGDRLVAATAGSISIDGGSLKVATGTAGGSISLKSSATLSVATGGSISVSGTVTVQAGGVMSLVTGSALRRPHRIVTSNVTLATDGSDSGTSFTVNGADVIAYLPAATKVPAGTNYRFSIASGGSQSGSDFLLRPNAADAIWGAVAGATDGEVLTLASGSIAIGDNVEVIQDSTDWYVRDFKGTWTLANPS